MKGKNFKMFARYADNFEFETIDYSENDCVCNISEQENIHGDCIFYTVCNGYDEENNCYWVDGEYFSDFDEKSGSYID